MGTVGNLVGNLKLNNQHFSSGLRKSRGDVGSFVNFSSLKFAGFAAAAATAAVALYAMQKAVRAGVSIATDNINAEKRLANVMRSTQSAAGQSAEAIKEYASQRQKLTNFAGGDTIGASALLATFTEIRGDNFYAAVDAVQDLSAFMGQDLKTSAIQVGKALNAPIEGVSALARTGIQFTQDQKDLIKSLVETGRTAEAQKVILAELAKQFGGSAEALADPFIQAKNEFDDVLDVLGRGVRDIFVDVMGEIDIEEVTESLKNMIENFKTVWGPVIVDGITMAAEAMETLIKKTENLDLDALDALASGFTFGLVDVTGGAREMREMDRQARRNAANGNRLAAQAKAERLAAERRDQRDANAAENAAKDAKKTAKDSAIKEYDREMTDLEKQAERVLSSTLTPFQKFAEEYRELKRLLDANAIDQNTFDAALDQAAERAKPKTVKDTGTPAAALQDGSSAAVSRILDAARADKEKNAADTTAQNTGEMVKEAKKANQTAKEIKIELEKKQADQRSEFIETVELSLDS